MFQELSDLAKDVVEDYNNPKRAVHYYAHYTNLSITESLGLRLAGLVSLTHGVIAEVGIDSGYGALVMAISSQGRAQVYSCDIREDCVEIGKARASKFGIENVHFIHGDVGELVKVLPELISFAHVDGSHEYEDCLKDLRVLGNYSKEGAVFGCDDMRMEDGSASPVWKAIDQFESETLGWNRLDLFDNFSVLKKG